ncbi:MAG: adenosylcobinamide-GDP ribazoletransferase [Cycloclasticus sp.]|nr:adenosylcobinamide-GDP ribazoletransferase [Cycloclasticus sp.]
MLRSFLIALQFLTSLPVPVEGLLKSKEIGRSAVYFPLAGLLIGALLAALFFALNSVDPLLSAALILTAWVLLTGVLHLDGLADSADAWVGGCGDREKTLALMKDPCCGTAAVASLVLLIMLKTIALSQLLAIDNWKAVLLTPLLGRAALLLIFLTTSYVRSNGLGGCLSEHLPQQASAIAILLSLLFVWLVVGNDALWLLFILGFLFITLREMMLSRIGGTTGDTAGALVVITETVALITFAVIG